MSTTTAEHIGKLILRLTLGVLLLLHGVDKAANGVAGIVSMLRDSGLPGVLSYAVYLGEIAGPVMVIAGFYTRLGAAFIVANMIFAIYLAHAHQLFSFTSHGGWALELQGFFLFTALTLVLIGPGRYAINSR